MRKLYRFKLLILLIIVSQMVLSEEKFPKPKIEFNPRKYVCYKTKDSLKIDGKLDEEAWQKAAWTKKFVDIEGSSKPKPKYDTKVKMLWDNKYMYFGAYLEEPHVWAKLKQRDTVIYYDNDFEVFIDPNSDTHEYYELELNAYNTIWDLLLTRPYRDQGSAIFCWDIHGLKSEVYIDGTLNDPDDRDRGWYVEIAYPWQVLQECAHKKTPPTEGDQWRINFSRVQWKTKIVDGMYTKKTNPETGEVLAESNWVWSPQGLIAMHYPEMWGVVQFTEKKINSSSKVEFNSKPIYKAINSLYNLYYEQREYKVKMGRYTSNIEHLENYRVKGYIWPPQIFANDNFFQIILSNKQNNRILMIDDRGKLEIKKK